MCSKSHCVVLAALILFAVGTPGGAQTYTVDPLWDSVTLGGGVLLAGASELFVQIHHAPSLNRPDESLINPLDRLAVLPYSRGVDIASSVLQYTELAAPLLLLLLLPQEQWLTAGVMYGETLAVADLTKNVLKTVFARYRPFVYVSAGQTGLPEAWDWYDSFPSGHATMVFASATCAAVTLARLLPGSPLVVPFVLADYGLATLTASFRVLSGMHFLTDIFAGAAIGAAIGYLVPLAHTAGGPASAGSSRSIQIVSVVVPL